MKTILVLTDFSIRADHAAHYALKLAQKIKANLLLCNIFPATGTAAVSTPAGWPKRNYEAFDEDSINELEELADRLNRFLDNKVPDGDFRPAIEQCSKAGPVG